MSARLLLLSRPAGLTAVRPAVISTPIRALSGSATLRLKESQSTDPNPAEFDKHKQDSIEKQKRGQGHWKPELASVSEETVKADRMSPGKAGKEALKQLQEKTKGHAEERLKHGTSMKDGL